MLWTLTLGSQLASRGHSSDAMTPPASPVRTSPRCRWFYPTLPSILRALLDFEDKNGQKVVAGDEWLFEGPGECFPVQPGLGSGLPAFSFGPLISSDLQTPTSPIFPSQAYIPQKEVEVIEIIQATVIKQNQALRLRARRMLRQGWQGAGDRWSLEVFTGLRAG